MTTTNLRTIILCLVSLPLLPASAQTVVKLASHTARYDASGRLLPWTPLADALQREMNWYLNSPLDHGFPRFATLTFMDGNYAPVPSRPDSIPAMQNAMGIISYLKYDRFTHSSNPKLLQFARLQGDYIITQALTPDSGKYPLFPHSTGWRDRFPQPPGSGSQRDHPYDIEPDKGGIAGYALTLLYSKTHDARYRDAALHIARTLAANMRPGDATHSPWPFRADWRTGEARGEISGNMSYNLRLFDELASLGYSEFAAPRLALWTWIRDFQIPSAALNRHGRLWGQFFEDHDNDANRTSWAPMNLARYLIEKRDALDPDWRAHALQLITFVNQNFTRVQFGIAVCGEQDEDRHPWGGANTTWASVLALYSAATGDPQFLLTARQDLILAAYAIDDDGCPRDSVEHDVRGGWQEDSHTDVIHNFVDALTAFPDWAH